MARRRRDGVGRLLATALPAVLGVAFAGEADRERYLLPAFWLLAAFAAAGAQMLFRRWSGFALIVLAATIAFANRHIADQRTNVGWPQYVDRVRAATPQGAIIVAEWALATPLAYAAYVERSFDDRIVE